MGNIPLKKSSVSFMQKQDFVERKGSECFSVTPEAESKLKTFDDKDILAIDVSVSSPATVIDVTKVEGIVDFINQRFIEEGITREDLNKSFKDLNV